MNLPELPPSNCSPFDETPPLEDAWYGPAMRAYGEECARMERERCATICDELGEYWSAYKDTALLNGDVDLSNAASGEPRAAEAIAAAIRGEAERKDEK